MMAPEDVKEKARAAISLLKKKLPELADLARIPEAKRESFYDRVRSTVWDKWHLMLPFAVRYPELRVPGKKARDAAIALQAAVDAIGDLDEEDRACVTTRFKNRKKFRDEHPAPAEGPYAEATSEMLARDNGWWDVLIRINSEFAFSNHLLPRLPPFDPKPRRGQRSGGAKHHRFRWLVKGIHAHAARCGGRLTFDRKNNGRGTLVSALKLIEPCLPPGLLPERLPLSSI